jgi:hypothetical protein
MPGLLVMDFYLYCYPFIDVTYTYNFPDTLFARNMYGKKEHVVCYLNASFRHKIKHSFLHATYYSELFVGKYASLNGRVLFV